MKNESSQDKSQHIINHLKTELENLECSSNRCKQSINTMMSNLGHELRTPLNGIVGFSELLNTTDLNPDEVKLYAGVIEESSNMLMSIIHDVMDIVKIETGNYQMQIAPFDLNDLIFQIYMKYRDRSESKGIDFYLENLVSEQFIIESSDNDINRILEKLIDNAIKFTRDGYIKVGYIDKGSHIVFTVRDTGIGIPPENQKNLFTKFVDEEVSKSRKVSGTGVDLALCNGLVKLLGGAITYNTASDKGSVFTFTIDNHYLKKR